jgi:hypothetical protein
MKQPVKKHFLNNSIGKRSVGLIQDQLHHDIRMRIITQMKYMLTEFHKVVFFIKPDRPEFLFPKTQPAIGAVFLLGRGYIKHQLSELFTVMCFRT